ncbi:hypothetical protein C8R43DRAFT_1109204 [Mycena crocata]|nr:hypothetical protein C8R43DRAFT_1109204 [Mycena crocata]
MGNRLFATQQLNDNNRTSESEPRHQAAVALIERCVDGQVNIRNVGLTCNLTSVSYRLLCCGGVNFEVNVKSAPLFENKRRDGHGRGRKRRVDRHKIRVHIIAVLDVLVHSDPALHGTVTTSGHLLNPDSEEGGQCEGIHSDPQPPPRIVDPRSFSPAYFLSTKEEGRARSSVQNGAGRFEPVGCPKRVGRINAIPTALMTPWRAGSSAEAESGRLAWKMMTACAEAASDFDVDAEPATKFEPSEHSQGNRRDAYRIPSPGSTLSWVLLA